MILHLIYFTTLVMRLYITYFLVLILVTSCQEKKSNKLVIAAAANVQFAMQELADTFYIDTDIKAEIIYGSSGKLFAQIIKGAPYDLFISANMKYPNQLYKAGFLDQKPSIYAFGKLVLWTQLKGIEPSIELLKSDDIKHIAMANPKIAPYGVATEQLLKRYGIFETIKNKLVYGESISQTNQFIFSGSAEIGFTAMSSVMSSKIATKGKWVALDTSTYSPIAQGVALIKKESKNSAQAQEFYRFLFTHKAQNILHKYGYSTY